MKEPIKDFYGKILGYIDTQSNGDKVVTDFYGKILGYYRKNQNLTTDFYGRIIGRGDVASSLIYREEKQ